MKESEARLVKRASKLWKSKLSSINDLENLAAELDALTGAFEGCQSDLEDLQIMRRALQLYKNVYQQLNDNRLTWAEFETLSNSLRTEVQTDLEDEEIPWPPDEATDSLVAIVTKTRRETSSAWIKALEADASDVARMSATDANRLHGRATDPPAILAEPHAKRLKQVLCKVEKRLNGLKIDWLVEKYTELGSRDRQEFLRRIQSSNGRLQ